MKLKIATCSTTQEDKYSTWAWHIKTSSSYSGQNGLRVSQTPLPETSDSKISLPTTQTSLPQTSSTSPNHVIQTQTMSSFTHATTLLHAHLKTHHKKPSTTTTTTTLPHTGTNRRNLISTFLATSTAVVAAHGSTQQALAQNWGTRSFIWEHFFGPGLSPEDAVARIKQTAEGLHDMREPLETLSWRYIMFYIRIKQAYLDQDLRTAFSTLPQNRRKDYVKTANELVSNFGEVFHCYFFLLSHSYYPHLKSHTS